MKKHLLLLISAIIFAHVLSAQDNNTADLITDRPDQTESAAIVPQGSFQIETGFVFEGDKANKVTTNNLALFTTLLRYGINQNFELRLGSAFLQNSEKPEQGEEITSSGLAPVYAGIKFKMLEEDGLVPEMAFMATVEIPGSGKEEFSPEYLASDLRFAIGYSLSDRLGLGINLGGRWDGSNPQPSGVYSLVLGYGISDKMSAFVESYGFLPQDEIPDHRMDAGLTYLMKPNLQIDVSAGLGLSEISPDYFINAGISWRIPE
jgi:hypothetical protein